MQTTNGIGDTHDCFPEAIMEHACLKTVSPVKNHDGPASHARLHMVRRACERWCTYADLGRIPSTQINLKALHSSGLSATAGATRHTGTNNPSLPRHKPSKSGLKTQFGIRGSKVWTGCGILTVIVKEGLFKAQKWPSKETVASHEPES